jgi:hypothetical protein
VQETSQLDYYASQIRLIAQSGPSLPAIALKMKKKLGIESINTNKI